ncbi:MAG: hypothetical protein JKX69_00345 [Rhodobacteraceae bacterium]|nr:hypothetical protein [Paracoccaceae bacterium]
MGTKTYRIVGRAVLLASLSLGGAAQAQEARALTAETQIDPVFASLRQAVQRCWLVDTGSAAARVTVGFELTPEGRVVANDVQLLRGSGGNDAAIGAAFAAARRAVLRCQSQSGYDLPADSFAHWRNVELTFDPQAMGLR